MIFHIQQVHDAVITRLQFLGCIIFLPPKAAYQSILTVGCHTLPFAGELLPEPFGPKLSSTIEQLCSQSYVVLDEFLDAEHTKSFVEEAALIEETMKRP